MGQGKEPGLWGETSLGSRPMVTRAAGHANGAPQQKHKGQLGRGEVKCCWKNPRFKGQEHRLQSPPPHYSVTSPVKRDALPPRRELQD